MNTSLKSSMTTHSLIGLEPDNLLAFLAMLGLLRSLNQSRSIWRARVHWSGRPPKAFLTISAQAEINDVVLAIVEGMGSLSTTFDFKEKKDVTFSRQDFRDMAFAAGQNGLFLSHLAALASDGVTKRNEDRVEATRLCAMFGQGHQHFLSRLCAMVKPDHEIHDEIFAALFKPWEYSDRKESFRWDPIEDRRYAHQFGNPSEVKNKVGTVAGANRLAAVGVMTLTCVPKTNELATLGVLNRNRECWICWPLAAVPTTLDGHRALLACPEMYSEERAASLASYGVKAVARARRVQVEKYFNYSRAILHYLSCNMS